MGDTVLREDSEGVATLTLNRPRRLNAITPELAEDLRSALLEVDADPAVRVIRLRGSGRSFCAGYDIGWGSEWMVHAEGGRPWDPMADLAGMNRFVQDTYMAIWRSRTPVIAQVHGFCVGGGNRPRPLLGPHRLRRGLPHRLPAGTRLGLADDRHVDLPAGAGALQAPAADR